jgi:hypothetical protein
MNPIPQYDTPEDNQGVIQALPAHTPLPWRWDPENSRIVAGEAGASVAVIMQGKSYKLTHPQAETEITHEQAAANADLIIRAVNSFTPAAADRTGCSGS